MSEDLKIGLTILVIAIGAIVLDRTVLVPKMLADCRITDEQVHYLRWNPIDGDCTHHENFFGMLTNTYEVEQHMDQ